MPAVSVYKPVADGGRPLVVLMTRDTPAYAGIELIDAQGNVIDVGRYSGRTNGGRPTYRFSRHGAGYSQHGNVGIRAGGVTYPIGNPALRDENVGPGTVPANTRGTPQTTTRPTTRPTGTVAGQAQQKPNPAGALLPLAAAVEGKDIAKVKELGASLGQKFPKLRFFERFGAPGTTTAAGTPSVTAALSGAPATPGWAASINAAAPWAIGALAGRQLVKHLSESRLEEAKNHFGRAYTQGKTGQPLTHTKNLLGYFGVKGLGQVAHEAGQGKDVGVSFSGGKPYINGLDPKEYQIHSQQQARKNIMAQGLDRVPSRLTYTPKEKAAQKILGRGSQANMANRWVLNEADMGK